MERKTYTMEREIPDHSMVFCSVKQYYNLLECVALNLEEDTHFPGLSKEDREKVYADVRALERIVTDFGYFVEDVQAFDDEEDHREIRAAQKQMKGPDGETE